MADTLIKDATFVRADTAVGLTPGTVGDGWTDFFGSTWQIASNKLKCNGTAGFFAVLNRPKYEGRLYQKMIVTQASLGSGNSGGFTLSCGPISNNWISFWIAGTTSAIIQLEGAGGQSGGYNPAFLTPMVVGHAYTYTVTSQPNASVSTQRDVTFTIHDDTAGLDVLLFSQVGSATLGTPILGTFGLVPFSTQSYDEVKCYDTYSSAQILANPFYLSGQTATTVSFAVSAASGGTGPYTAKLYRATTPNQAPGAGTSVDTGVSASISAAGVATLTHTPGTASPGFYKILWTDSAGSPSTATSVDVVGQVGNPLTSIVYIGDSTGAVANGVDLIGFPKAGSPGTSNGASGALSSPDYSSFLLQSLYGVPAGSQTFNACVSGTTSGQWAADTGGLLTNAIAGANAIGATVAHIRLGANDAKLSGTVSQATYQANISSICTQLFSGIGTLQKIVLGMPYYINPNHDGFAIWIGIWSDASDATILSYYAALQTLAAADPTRKFAEDTAAFYMTAQYPAWQYDGVHPNGQGILAWGHIMAQNISRILGFAPASSSGGGGGGGMNGGMNG